MHFFKTFLLTIFIFFPSKILFANEYSSEIFRVMLSNCNANKGFAQTGFRGVWNGQDGIITALHGVAGCNKYSVGQGKDIFVSDLKLLAVDIDRDIAFLSSKTFREIQGTALKPIKYNIQNDGKLTVIGYPNGALEQFDNKLDYYTNPLRLLGSWHQTVKNMCEYRKSPNCNINVLLVRDDPLLPGHSGVPIFNQHNEIVGVASGGLKGGAALLNWMIPYSDIQLDAKEQHKNELKRLKTHNFTKLFAIPSTIDDSQFQDGEGATITGYIMYGGYGSKPIGIASNYTKAFATILLIDSENRKDIPVDITYNNSTGKYIMQNVPSGKFTPFVRLEAGYPFYKKSAGDYISHLSGLNEDIVVAPHDKHIHRNLNVVKSIHLKRPVDNQKERKSTNDDLEILYKQNYHPTASVFEWEPVPKATRYNVRILLKDNSTGTTKSIQNFNTTKTKISPNLDVNYGDTNYMFLVYAYKGNNYNDLIGEFTNFYKNGHGGWFEFKIEEKPNWSEPNRPKQPSSNQNNLNKIVYNANFSNFPHNNTAYGSAYPNGSVYTLQAKDNHWLGFGKSLPITPLKRDFTINYKFKVLSGSPSISLNLSNAGTNYTSFDFYYSISNEHDTFSISENWVKNNFYVNRVKEIAQTQRVPSHLDNTNWSNTNTFTINRTGNQISFYLNNTLIKSFPATFFNLKQFSIGIAGKSKVNIISVEASIP